MSIKIGEDIVVEDDRKGVLLTVNIGAYSTASLPTSNVETGAITFDTDRNKIVVWDGGSWS